MSPTLRIACVPQDRAGRKVVCVKGYRVKGKQYNVTGILKTYSESLLRDYRCYTSVY